MAEPGKEQTAGHFLNLIHAARRGKFKLYIGMAAGVGKTYRMLQEAHALQQRGLEVRVGFVETHGRKETAALVDGLTLIPRRAAFYKGKLLEELDLEAVLQLRPDIVIIDELAHSNIPGSRNEKRWQDVAAILEAGINVISAVNIQHIESLHEAVREITGIAVAERIPDKLLRMADEIVNIDLTAADLISRLKEGKVYPAEKVPVALENFFRPESILQLRELALKEVAGQIEQRVELEVPRGQGYRHERLLACIGSRHEAARNVIRKSARLAGYYQAQWTVLYVETPKESADRIALETQRHLINNFRLATGLGAAVVQAKARTVAQGIADYAETHDITTVCIGKPRMSLFHIIIATSVFNRLLRQLNKNHTDLIILS